MDPAAFAELTGAVPLPSPTAASNGAAYCVNSGMFASVPPHMVAQPAHAAAAESSSAVAARRRKQEEDAAIYCGGLQRRSQFRSFLVGNSDLIRGASASKSAQGIISKHDISYSKTGGHVLTPDFDICFGLMQDISQATCVRRTKKSAPAADGEFCVNSLVHLLVTCAGAIEAGDYSAAHGNLAEAHVVLAAISTTTGVGRVADHFAAALSQRLFPAYPEAAAVAATPMSPATPAELHRPFHEAGAQWTELMHALAKRRGGPPSLRITIIGPVPATGPCDELREVGLRLAELAQTLDVPFSFRLRLGDWG
ncbi:hypothetical protein EJB05_35974, partial [Eragrostis curvula]